MVLFPSPFRTVIGIVALLATGLVFGACQQSEAPRTYTASLQPLGEMAAMGSAEFTRTDSTLTVDVEMGAVAPDTTHPQHLHRGTCNSPGPVVLPLEVAEGGFPRADSTGNFTYHRTLSSVPDSLGERILVVHAPDGTPVSCGPIEPAQREGAS